MMYDVYLKLFVRDMQKKLNKHKEDRKDSWKDIQWDILTPLLHEIEEMIRNNDPMECADIANYAFFAWYRLKHGGKLQGLDW